MYTYKRAVGISLLDPQGEELLDISAVPVKEFYTTWVNLVIVVTDGLVMRDVAIQASDYINEFNGFDGTIQQWLDMKKTSPLKTSNTLPGTEYRYVTTHDIQYEWFSLFPGDLRIADDRQDQLTTTGARDIRVKKTDGSAVNYDDLVNKGLWGINGHLVRGVRGTADEVYLVNAGKHFNVNDNIHVNFLNFNTVSSLATYAITAEQIYFEGHSTYRFLRLDAPKDKNGNKISLKDKTVWLSIGGRLTLNDVVEKNGEYGVTIHTGKVDWFSRIFDSKELIDLSSVIDLEREQVPADFFHTEEFFTKLLLDPSSFMIVLDNPHLHVWTTPITSYKYPFTFHTEETKRVPLMVNNGLLPKYNVRRIINRRLLDIDLGIKRQYLNETTGVHNEGNLYHGHTNRFQPSTLFQGYLLYIRSIIQRA